MTDNTAVATGTPSSLVGSISTPSQALVPITGQELQLLSQTAADPTAVKKALNMRDGLTAAQQAEAKQEAAEKYAAMKDNPQVITVIGKDATQDVDAVGKQLLQQLGGESIRVIKELLKGLNDGMRKLEHGYDVKNNPEARQHYDEWSGKVKKLLHLGKDFFEMMLEDFQKFDTQLDKAYKQLDEQEQIMTRNLGFQNELYKANQVAVDKLVFAIAVMEYIAEMAAAEAESIVVDQSQPDWQRKREEHDRIAQIAQNMLIKAGDFKGIYFISIATSPQVRMSSNQVLGVISKLETTKTQTIGAMRRILAQWIMLIQAQDATALAEFVNDTNKVWTEKFFEDAPELMRQIAEGVERPVLSADTIALMAKSLEDSSNALLAEMQKGYEARKSVDDAILTALPRVNEAGAKVSDETIKMVLGKVLEAAQQQAVPALPAA